MPEQLLYDSVEVHFYLGRGIRQFFIHMLCPLFIWLSPNLQVQGFYSASIPVSICYTI